MIERVETILLRVPLQHGYKGSYSKMRNRCTIITRVHTCDVVVGECYNADTDEEQDQIVAIINDELAPAVVGLDETCVERVWQAMLPSTLDQLRDRRRPMQAIACIDSTVWDAFSPTRDPIFWELWVNRPAPVDGLLPLPDTPGFGWALDHEFTERSRVDR